MKIAHEKEVKKMEELREKRRLEETAAKEKEKLERFIRIQEKEKSEEAAESSYANSLLLKAQKASSDDLDPILNVMKHNKSKFYYETCIIQIIMS